ncbi:EGF-like repeat and discoidin I-like domain-containing protein 3 isoform X2 [Numida meleagris]|uniref:EGF-like repeat and discoidin I-like domain-containing protein 3 isoform X2 n=1 Tax=Numida meleagris TaxID=8996 RepID=UPI000B3DE01D|nr:EGF-like repeat and discoidin I-like domain-containing protein 3 isoform X2 [Numida meleagris]
MSRAVLAWLVLCGSLAAPRLARGDLCDSSPCKNGGICLSGLNDDFYSCECPEGFTDPNCSSIVEVASIEEEPTSAGPCLPNPCHNGGMCEISEAYRGDTFIGYVCKCPEGFNGIHCQHNVNECEAEPCKNGGICTDLVANYSCECPGEFMGRNCQQRCSGPLGIEGGIVSNQQITASSTHRALFGLQKWYPYYARLNKKGLVNAWTAAENDRWPWIQINLQKKMRVTGVITQGAKRIGSPEYVKSYKIAYSNDGKSWAMYKVKGTNEDMVFRGNVDNNTPYANSFTPPIKSQYIRLYPQVCRRHCTLRMELLGCELSGCSEPLGMKSGHIQDYQITASSVFRTLNMDMFAWEPRKARLDKQGKVNAWTSGHNDQSQWLQVDLLVRTKVTGIITQGAKDFGHVQFVGSYKLAYSNDGEHWIIYQDEKQKKDKAPSEKPFTVRPPYCVQTWATSHGNDAELLEQDPEKSHTDDGSAGAPLLRKKVFQGNFDNDTHRKNVIDPPIYARHIRILPWSWYGRITLRSELLGCTEED